MASSSFELKRKSLENIIESLLCYKCKAAPGFFEKEKNRYFCTNNSHQLCDECKSKCDCGSEVGKCPNPLVDQILKDLPTYCSHYKRGCRELFIQATDFVDHCQDCVFRLQGYFRRNANLSCTFLKYRLKCYYDWTRPRPL